MSADISADSDLDCILGEVEEFGLFCSVSFNLYPKHFCINFCDKLYNFGQHTAMSVNEDFFFMKMT